MDNIGIAKFKRLVKQGYCQSDIMEKMGISERTYFRCKKETSVDLRKKEIDKRLYFDLVRQGYTTKVELAKHLRVSHPTLLNFEKNNEIVRVIGRGLYVQGHNMILPNMLHISKNKTNEHTSGLPTIKGAAKNLKTIIGILEQFADYDPDAIGKVRVISEALKLIESTKI